MAATKATVFVADAITDLVQYLRHRVPDFVPEIGIICGSGLGHLRHAVTDQKTISYKELAPYGFPISTVEGHGRDLIFGMLSGKRVVLMTGRFHYYEGYHPSQVAMPVRVLAALGIRVLLVTNAAGGVNPEYKVGDLMVIHDQIALTALAGSHPLVGKNDTRFGDRFPAVSPSFAPELADLVEQANRELGPRGVANIRHGTYCGVSGPSYETPHEIAALHKLGGDSVGMSTVGEIIVAAHAGLKVLGLSMITNQCLHPALPAESKIPAPSHGEVLDATKATEKNVQALVVAVVAKINISSYPHTKAYHSFKDYKASDAPPRSAKSSVGKYVAAGLGVAAILGGIAFLLTRKTPTSKAAPIATRQ